MAKWGDRLRQPAHGATLEAACWYSAVVEGDWSRAKAVCLGAMEKAEQQYAVRLSPLRWNDLRPGSHPQMPEVPAGAPPEPRLLHVEADVVSLGYIRPVLIERDFVDDLEPKDLALLRRLTAEAWLTANPGAPYPSNDSLDRAINRFGPQVALKTLKDGVKD